MRLRFFLHLLSFLVVGMGAVGYAFADSPWTVTPIPGLTSSEADGEYLRLDLTNAPVTGDNLYAEPPSGTFRLGTASGNSDDVIVEASGGTNILMLSASITRVNTDLDPGTSASYNLGDNSVPLRWNNLYLATSDIANDGTDTTLRFDNDLNLQTSTTGGFIKPVPPGGEGSGGISRIFSNNADDLYVGNNVSHLRFLDTTTIRSTADFIPSGTGQVDLGIPTFRWENLYLEDSDIVTDGTDTTFQATGDLEVHSDVELRMIGGSVSIQSDQTNEVRIGVDGSTTLEIGETNVFIDGDLRQTNEGDYVQVGLTNIAGGPCAAPVTCAAASLGAQFVCNDTNTTKSSNLCVCLRDTADAYVWVGLYGAGGSVCP